MYKFLPDPDPLMNKNTKRIGIAAPLVDRALSQKPLEPLSNGL